MYLKRTATIILTALAALTMTAQSIRPKQNDKDGKWGYISTSTGKWVVKPKYSQATALSKVPGGELRGYVTQNGKTGIIDDNGNILGAGVKFEQITPMREGSKLFFVTVNGKKGIANYNGAYIIKPEATEVTPLGEEGWFMTIKGKQGLVNADGQWVMQPLYSDIDTSEPGYFIATKGGKASLLDRNGTELIAPKDFTSIKRFNLSLWKVSKGEKTGLYDLEKKSLVMKPEYADVAEPLLLNGEHYYPIANKEGKWGVLNSLGKDVVKTKYSKIESNSDIGGLLLYQNGEIKDFYIPGDKKPCRVYSYRKSQNGPFEEFEFAYDKNWRTHKIEYITLPNGDKIERNGVTLTGYKNGTYLLKTDKKASLYSVGGELITADFDEKKITRAGDCIITQDNILISPLGELYRNVTELSSYPLVYSVTPYNGEGPKCLINDKGEVFKMKGDEFKSTYLNLEGKTTRAYVCKLGDKYGIISEHGDILFPQEYSYLKDFHSYNYSSGDQFVAAKEDGKMEFINLSKNNTVKTETDMDEVVTYWSTDDKKNIIIAGKKDGRHGLFDFEKSKWIVPARYDSIRGAFWGGENFCCYKDGTFSVYSYDKDSFIVPESKNYTDYNFLSGSDDYKVYQGDRIGVVDSKTWQELIAPMSGVEKIDYSSYYDMIEITANGKTKYYTASGKPVDTTPRIINNGIYLEHGRTQGGKNATFANFDLTFQFYDDCFTVYCDVFYKNGQKVYRGSRQVRGEDRICASGPLTHRKEYFTFDSDDLGIKSYESRVDYYIKFRFVNERTGKEVTIPGNKKLTFYWHR